MILSLILTIFSVTYTLSSTTEVKPSGVLPDSSTYTYERSAISGQKGQMTAGNATRLELKGWDGYVIRSVELKMRSNKSSGRGSLMMTIGDEEVWSIDDQDFCNDAWAGMYTTDWVSISKQINVCVNNEPIEILISATENSLYIKSYTIYYEKVNNSVTPDLPSIPSISLKPKTYTVHFNTGCNTSPPSITQSKPNTPVVLPQWQDTLSWYFLGWSETEIADNKIRTPIFQAGETYMPCRNTNLWAVYSDVKEDAVVTDYSTGLYTITRCNDFTHEISNSGVALAGNIHGEELQLADVQMKMNRDSIYCLESEILADMLYELVFNDDSTVYITHSITSEPIGYKETKLRDVHTLWKYRVLSDGSIVFYTSFNGKDYAINFIINANGVPVAILRNTDINKWNNNGFWLFKLSEKHYTSTPSSQSVAVENIEKPSKSYKGKILLGIFELRCYDGKKVIHVH